MEEDTIYADDSSHPIPSIDVCDVQTVRTGGGATLSLIIATPMTNDLRSRQRLTMKIERYLQFIRSREFESECGCPKKENTTVAVSIHEDSHAEIFALIEDCRGWIEDNHAGLVVKLLPKSI